MGSGRSAWSYRASAFRRGATAVTVGSATCLVWEVLELVEGTLLQGSKMNLSIFSDIFMMCQTSKKQLQSLRPKAENGEPIVFYKKMQARVLDWKICKTF